MRQKVRSILAAAAPWAVVALAVLASAGQKWD